MSDRMRKLETMLQRSPADPFLLYALAMEHKKAGHPARALELLEQVTRADTGYCYAYHQQGLIYESQQDLQRARMAFTAGIDAARRTGDAHALGEIESALADLLQRHGS